MTRIIRVPPPSHSHCGSVRASQSAVLAVPLAVALAVALLASLVGPVDARVPLPAAAAPSGPAPRSLDLGDPTGFEPEDAGYHTYSEMAAELLQVQTDHPSLVQRFSLGRSYQGRELWAVKITRDVSNEHDTRPAALFDGLHHAREHLSVEMALAIVHLLADNDGTATTLGTRVTKILDSTVVYVVPMVNPDGGEYDIAGGGSCPTGGTYRCWRKNRQPNSGSTAVGTDLNRNYGYDWGCCGGSSGSKSSETYRGPSAFSAPETQRMRDFVNARVTNGINRIRTHITFHSAGEMVLWPYGHTYTDVPPDMTSDDHAALVRLGQAMAATNGYGAAQSSNLYVTDGDQIDWMYGVHRIFSYTFEMGPRGTTSRSYPSDDHIYPETRRNREAVLYLLEHTGCRWSVLGTAAVAAHCGPYSDDFEIYRDSRLDPDGTDSATGGVWERGIVEGVTRSGHTLQPSGAVSGKAAMVTGRRAGASAYAGDLDGRTTVLLRSFGLTAGRTYRLAFRGYLAHDANGSSADYLRVVLVPPSGSARTLYQITGRGMNVDAAWTSRSAAFTVTTTGTYRLRLEAVDGGVGNLVEAGVDDLWIAAQ